MGNCKSSNSTQVAPNKEATLLMLGLDNSGKTTVVANLSGESTEGTTPSIGFSCATLEINHFVAKFYDLGGSARLRNIWKNYFSEACGIIFVVDAGSESRLPEAKEALNDVLEHERIKGKPLLVLANKQDCDNAIQEGPLSEQLNLNALLGEHKNLSRVVRCIALKSASGNKSDPSIKNGVKWLLGQIGRDYNQLRQRVNADVALQRAMEEEKRRERAERVRKIKEERERQQALAGITQVEETDQADVNPFKPINQAAMEIEAREKAMKARNLELQQRLTTMHDNANQRTEPLEGSNEAGGMREGGEGTSQTPGEVGAASEPGGEGGGGEGGGRISLSTSGLSDSSDSLTDVTPEEGVSSSESLHLEEEDVSQSVPTDGPLKPSLDGPPTVTRTTKCSDLSSKKRSSRKKKGRSSLIARLKKHNKTAPIMDSSQGEQQRAMSAKSSGTPSPLPPLASKSLAGKPRAPSPLLPPLTGVASSPGTISNRITPSPTTPPILRNVWTAAKLEQAELPLPDSVHSSQSAGPSTLMQPANSPSSTSTPHGGHSPLLSTKTHHMSMDGLPGLPQSRVVLPPLQITKQPIGIGDKAIHTEEDIAAIPQESIIQLSEPPTLSPAVQPLSS